MVPGQVAASSIAAMALGLLIEMVPSGSMIWPPPDDLTHSRASQVRPSYELPCQTKPQMSGYDVSDYRDIDPAFGTLADFDDMVAKAHRLGLKVIIDQVLSHCSNQHPFFLEARSSRDNPKSDWFVWADPNPDGSAPIGVWRED